MFADSPQSPAGYDSDGGNAPIHAILSSSGIFPFGNTATIWPADVEMVDVQSSGSVEVPFEDDLGTYFHSVSSEERFN